MRPKRQANSQYQTNAATTDHCPAINKVNADCLEACLIAQQVSGKVCNISWLPDPTQRMPQSAFVCGIDPAQRQHGGICLAWADGINANAKLAILMRSYLAQRDHTRLGSVIGSTAHGCAQRAD